MKLSRKRESARELSRKRESARELSRKRESAHDIIDATPPQCAPSRLCEDLIALYRDVAEARPLLKRLMRRAVKGEALPATFTVGAIGYEAQRQMEEAFGVPLRRNAGGKVAGALPEALRDAAAWREVAARLGVCGDNGSDRISALFTRLRWQNASHAAALDALEQEPVVRRFLSDDSSCAAWARLFAAAASRIAATAPTTLSQFGSDLFGDSKCLRAGALKKQLVDIVSALTGIEGGDREVLSDIGIEENPYTSAVTVFAPFAFTLKSGETFDFPAQLHAQGLAAQLPMETVAKIERIEWLGADRLITTSENAAPFARYVEKGMPSAYTEGYPNWAVQTILRLFAEVGVKARHAGDADLDGFRIAEQVGLCIPVYETLAARIMDEGLPQGIALSDVQRVRAEKTLAASPGFRYAASVGKMLERGCWYEQEAFPL